MSHAKIQSKIVSGDGLGFCAKVNQYNQLVIGREQFDESSFNEMGTTGTAYNFFKPRVGYRFVITGAMCYGDRDIDDNNSTIISIYEASSEDSTTEDKVLIKFGVAKKRSAVIPPLNLLVTEGKYVNAQTDDDDIFLTILGHYIRKAE